MIRTSLPFCPLTAQFHCAVGALSVALLHLITHTHGNSFAIDILPVISLSPGAGHEAWQSFWELVQIIWLLGFSAKPCEPNEREKKKHSQQVLYLQQNTYLDLPSSHNNTISPQPCPGLPYLPCLALPCLVFSPIRLSLKIGNCHHLIFCVFDASNLNASSISANHCHVNLRSPSAPPQPIFAG